ncbi:hypothetical protein [Paracoccus sp. (in: a-proteobacteria)]|uniref:hypothetical protein n=1 Tax=Paracoccus sp. TaxID=267 RepID=UPI003A8410C7
MITIRPIIGLAVAALVAIGVLSAAESRNERLPEADECSGRCSFSVGEVLPAEAVDLIEDPGRFGLGAEPRDNRYAVAMGKLIRIDPRTYQVKSILRQQVDTAR